MSNHTANPAAQSFTPALQLEALFGSGVTPTYYPDGSSNTSATSDDHDLGTLYTRCLINGDVAFFYTIVKDPDPSAKRGAPFSPTVVLRRGDLSILIAALDARVSQDEAQPVAHAMDTWFDENIPLHGAEGWQMVHCDPQQLHTLAELEAAYLLEQPAQVETDIAQVSDNPDTLQVGDKLFDATVKRRIRLADYDSTPFVFSFGQNKESKHWKPSPYPLPRFIEKLCQHVEGPKNGPAYVLGDMVPGQRLKNSVKAMYGIGLDSDVGIPSEDIDRKCEAFGFTVVRYTTHSNGATLSEFKKDRVVKFANGRDVDAELIREFLEKEERWHPSMLDSIEFLGTDHNEKGIVYQVAHRPMPKHRVFIPTARPYEIANEGATQKEATDKWAKVIDATATLLEIDYDKACIDPSRLFYFPRHSEKKPFEISVFGGPLFDERSLELSNPLEDFVANLDKGKSKSVTEEGRKLGRWSIKRAAGFQIVDVLETYAPDRIRGNASQGRAIECPFDEDHSNPGDTDDVACFVVNAGEGVSEIFTISCRHETCRNKTNLDHLGKMIKDGWFEENVLQDESFNAIIVDEETGEADGAAPDENAAPRKTTLQNILSDIGQLTPDSNWDDHIRPILVAMAKAEPEDGWAKDAIRKIRDRHGFAVRDAWKFYESCKPEEQKEGVSPETEKQRKELAKRMGDIFGAALHYPDSLGDIVLGAHDGRPYLFQDGKYPTALCAPIVIVGGVRYLERDHERALRVKFLNAENECVSIDIPARLLAQKSGHELFGKLRAAGWAGGTKGADFVLEYFGLAQPKGITVYDTGGWKRAEYLFLSGETCPADARLELATEATLPGPHKAGTLDGAKAAAKAMCENQKLIPLQAGFFAGLAGIVAGAASHGTLVYSFEGPTSKGKSTAEMFCLSHFADPRLAKEREDKKECLFFTGETTKNALEDSLKKLSGGAVGIDEFGLLGAKTGQDLVFMAVSGSGKGRMDKNRNRVTPTTWTGGTLVLSAEVGFSQRLKMEQEALKGGLTVRALPILVGEEHQVTPEEWKPVAALLDNYGHVGPAFVRAMIDKGWAGDPLKIEKRIQELLDDILDAGADAQQRRAAELVAYPLLAAEIAQEAGLVPVEFKAKALCKRLWADAMASDLAAISPAKRGAGILLNWLVANRGGEIQKLPDTEKERSPREAMGYFDICATVRQGETGKNETGVLVYVIRADVIEAKAGGAVGRRELLAELEAQGYLVRNPAKPNGRTWNGFAGLGKTVQYVVLRQDMITDD